MTNVVSFLQDENGATAVEYGLLAAILSAALIATYQGVQDGLRLTYTALIDAMQSVL